MNRKLAAIGATVVGVGTIMYLAVLVVELGKLRRSSEITVNYYEEKFNQLINMLDADTLEHFRSEYLEPDIEFFKIISCIDSERSK